eukprot:8233078-Pyramimonas_sp.AAC.2
MSQCDWTTHHMPRCDWTTRHVSRCEWTMNHVSRCDWTVDGLQGLGKTEVTEGRSSVPVDAIVAAIDNSLPKVSEQVRNTPTHIFLLRDCDWSVDAV